ncbi:MAG: FtsW/RodA/SpoVE family cell cycle protein, partial [Pseudomonadota bacterium]
FDDIRKPLHLFIPLCIVMAPAALVLRQPDLGTAVMLLMGAGAIFFVSGVRLWKFGLVIASGIAAVPIVWQNLREYQQKRILTFLDPESDQLGAGYHILQSKIALGSGGVWGRGFMEGTQSHLNFLPEKQTDFIFTMLAEELGLAGGLLVLSLYVMVLVYGFIIAYKSRNQFGRLISIGIITNFFLYIFINVAMVMGVVPVVGVPLPLISYGGTAMLTVMFSFGILMSAYVHREMRIQRTQPGMD